MEKRIFNGTIMKFLAAINGVWTKDAKKQKTRELFAFVAENKEVLEREEFANFRLTTLRKIIELIIEEDMSDLVEVLETVYGLQPPIIDTCPVCLEGKAQRLLCGHHAHWKCLDADMRCPHMFCGTCQMRQFGDR